MKAVIEWGKKKIEINGDTIHICDCEMCFEEFEEVALWIDAAEKISCFEK